MNIYLVFNKIFLEYSSMHLLDQRVDILSLATAEEKLTIIRNLKFSKTLTALNKYLRLIDYLKQYILYYITIAKSL